MQVDTRYSGQAHDLAIAACERLNIRPWENVLAFDVAHGCNGVVPMWMVIAEEMRRFDVYAQMHAVSRDRAPVPITFVG